MTVEDKQTVKVGRKEAREELFKLVFESEITGRNTKELLNDYMEREEAITNINSLEFIKEYMTGLSDDSEKIIETLNEEIENWNLERIGNVERSLLKVSTYEIMNKKVPYEIAINEAVELSKTYGDIKTFEFVNGVLAKIVKKFK